MKTRPLPPAMSGRPMVTAHSTAYGVKLSKVEQQEMLQEAARNTASEAPADEPRQVRRRKAHPAYDARRYPL